MRMRNYDRIPTQIEQSESDDMDSVILFWQIEYRIKKLSDSDMAEERQLASLIPIFTEIIDDQDVSQCLSHAIRDLPLLALALAIG